MNWADWVILAILVVSSLISLKRGFVKEALSMANWVFAFFVAMTFRSALAELLVKHVETPSLRELAAFAILFVFALVVGAMVNFLVSEVVKATGLAGTDRFLGMVFGLIRGFILVMAILLLVPAVVAIDEDPWWKESLFIPHMLEFKDLIQFGAQAFTDFMGRLFSSVPAESVDVEAVEIPL